MSPRCWGGFPRRRAPMSGAPGPRPSARCARETERRAAPLRPRTRRPVDAGREPDQVAPRAHHLVLRDLPAQAACSPAIACSTSASRFLFNSYYDAAGPRHARPQRGLITRPNVAEVAAYRAHVDARGRAADRRAPTRRRSAAIVPIVELGLHHEQQHQELCSPTSCTPSRRTRPHPAYDADWQPPACRARQRRLCRDCPTGIHSDRPRRRGFCFDNEGPRIRCCCSRRASRAGWSPTASGSSSWPTAATRRPTLWLSDGWATVRGRRLGRAGLLAQHRRRLVLADARRACSRSIRPRRSAMSATTRPTPSRAGPASTCRPRPSGRSRRAPGCSTTPSASCGNGRAAPIRPIRASRRRRRARRIQRQVHGQPDGAARLVACDARRACARRAIAISSIRRRAGSSPACGLPITPSVSQTDPHDQLLARKIRRCRCTREPTSKFAADVIAGLDGDAEAAAAEVFLRQRRLARCSSASPRCRNIIRRAPSSASCDEHARRHRGADSAGRGAGRVRQRLEHQDAHPARRGAARSRPMCRSTSRREFLREQAATLRRDYPALAVLPVAADFTQPFELPARDRAHAARRLFPGLDHRQFRAARGGGVPAPRRPHPRARARRFIVGVDLVKDAARAATPPITTPQGVTAQFNLNLLARINRELGANFDLRRFEHHAFYNRERSRIEMHLASLKRQTVKRRWANASSSAPARPSTPRTATSIRSSRSARWRAAPAGRRPRCGPTPDGYFSVHALTLREAPSR